MGRWILTSLAMALLCFGSGALGVFMAADLVLGDRTPPFTRAGGELSEFGKSPLYASHTVGEGYHSSTFFSLIPEGEDRTGSSLGVMTRKEGSGGAVGAYFYAENEGSGAPAWGLNAIARTYRRSPAVGMEVNGVNDSGRFGLVRGVDIVNGGNAPTQYALGIGTSVAAPAGKPRYGIVLAGPAFGYTTTAPASRTGILIDHIDSGEAIQIAAGDFITLDGEAGQIRMRFNPESEQIEFYNGERLAHAFAMNE